MNKYQIQNKLFNAYAGIYFFKMLAFEKKSPEAKRRYQYRQLKSLIERAYELPIYQQKFREGGWSLITSERSPT